MRINPAAMIVGAMAVCTVAAVTPMLLVSHATAQAPVAGSASAGDGAALYQANCSACHQANGKGIPGAFPALVGSPVVTGPDAGYLAVVLNGRGGMPAFKGELDDATLAGVMTYVRTAWSVQGAPITPAAVAAARTAAFTPPAGQQAH